MSYDEELAERVRRVLPPREFVVEKEMFGGLTFLLDGRMFVGIIKDELMVRVGPERYEEALTEAGARPMDFTGRPMRGYVFVGPAGFRTDESLKAWVKRGVDFVSALGAKKPKTSKVRKWPPKKKRPV